MDVEKITQEIKDVHINLASMHPLEYQELTRLFFGEIMENGWYGMDEVTEVLKNLPYEKHTKEIIYDIADVICKLRDQPKTVGRTPKSYLRVMKLFFKNQ